MICKKEKHKEEKKQKTARVDKKRREQDKEV